MSFIHSSVYLTLSLFCVQSCNSLANSTYYRIQNLGTNHCLSAGPALNSSSNMTLFKEGQLISTPCSNLSDPSAMTSSQQWMVRLLTDEPGRNNRHVQLAMQNSVTLDDSLNATIRGEFITYFPNTLDLENANTTATTPDEFRVVDSVSSKCLTDDALNERVGFEMCVGGQSRSSTNSQLWIFSIVNEIQLIHQSSSDRMNASRLN